MRQSHLALALVLASALPCVGAVGCGGDGNSTTGTGGGSATSTTTGTDTGSTGTSGTGSTGASGAGSTGAGGAGSSTSSGSTSTSTGGGAAMFVEKKLNVQLALSGATLTITVKDAENPVLTDAWLYTLKNGALSPLTDFTDPDSKRRYRGLLLPCTLAGKPSGLAPCDKGELNGIMTDAIREKIVGGVPQSAIDGKVSITLGAAPTSTIVVVVAVEDERYAGAAAIKPDGKPDVVPASVGVPEKHTLVTYTNDVKPILDAQCVACHAAGGLAEGLPLDTYDHVVNFNFGYEESAKDCEAKFPNDPAGLDACKKAITHVEYMIELGAPTLGPMMRRARPDEEKGASEIGLKWFGSGGSRFGGDGDRRMPPTNTTAETSDDDPTKPTYFDDNPQVYQVLFDWVAQGAQK